MAGEITLGVRSFKRARIVYAGEHQVKKHACLARAGYAITRGA